MRVSNLGENRTLWRPARLAQSPAWTSSGITLPREATFRIIDENGFHVVTEGKRFPFSISSVRKNDGELLPIPTIQGVALSDENSIVHVPLQISIDALQSQDSPVDAMLTLSGTNGITYPIFVNRKLRFTVPPASAEPLDLQAIWVGVVKKNEADAAAKSAAAAAKSAADEAAYSEQMITNYQNGLATEAQAQAAAERAQQAADEAAAKQQAADAAALAAAAAAAAAEAAKAKAAGETAARNQKIMWAVGGAAALGLVGYLAFGAFGK